MRKVTSYIEFLYTGNYRGRKISGVSQSTEYWEFPDGADVNEFALAERHKKVWIKRIKDDDGVLVDPRRVRMTNIRITG